MKGMVTLTRAALSEPVSRTPVWFMRQAGRSLPEYREAREGIAMLDACLMPDLTAEITLQPVRRHGVDAAIFFSDIVVPLKIAGMDVEIKPGVGPVFAHPVRTREDLARVPDLTADMCHAISQAVTLTRQGLPDDTALIGFAGAPFTVASYLIEGGPSKNHEKTKAMMLGDPELFSAILSKLAHMSATFIQAQLDAGAHAFQLFDSWAGYLNRADYERYVLPHSRTVFDTLAHNDVPSIHFGVTTGELLGSMSTAGSSVMGVDFRVALEDASKRVQPGQALPGNLDPALVFAPWEVIESKIEDIVRAGLQHGGHIFNLGHGVLPTSDPTVLTRIVEEVHTVSSRLIASGEFA